jgi:hypothetical protein
MPMTTLVLARKRSVVSAGLIVLAWPALYLSLGQGVMTGGREQGTAAQRKQTADNLRRLAKALIDFNWKNTYMPASADVDLSVRRRLGISVMKGSELAQAKGKVNGKPLPLLSWRVAILPFLGEEVLFKEFKLDEPWDGDHNKKLIPRMPKVFAPIRGKTREPGTTYYQVFNGPDAPFDGMIGPRAPSAFQDGMFATFLVVEGGEPVIWTSPRDVDYDAKKPLPKLGGQFPDGFHVAMADGSVRFVPRDANEKVIRAAITPRGNDPLGLPGKEVK